VLFLSAYSLNFSPIEEAFFKIKAHLKIAAARTREALVEAMGRCSLASRPRMPGDGSLTVATRSRLNPHEYRCSPKSGKGQA
jgi:hypothetical protein